jgi:hypothetical protein
MALRKTPLRWDMERSALTYPSAKIDRPAASRGAPTGT